MSSSSQEAGAGRGVTGPPGGRGGRLTLPAAQVTPGAEDVGTEDPALGMGDQEDMEASILRYIQKLN